MIADVESVTRTITQERIANYADASGDRNPIHVHGAFARGTPFGGTIAHGMLVLALIGEMLHRALGERWLASGALKVRFKAPARPGDTITATARVADGGRAYAVECVNQSGGVLVEGRATLGEEA